MTTSDWNLSEGVHGGDRGILSPFSITAHSPSTGYTRKQRIAANVAVGRAIKDGRLVKPDACEGCGVKAWVPGDNGARRFERRLHAHHFDYSLPLEVVWICTSCHGTVHRRLYERVCSICRQVFTTEGARSAYCRAPECLKARAIQKSEYQRMRKAAREAGTWRP